MKIFKLFFLGILFIGLNSCSSSDDSGTGTITSISLTPSATTETVGSVITFNVVTNLGNDVTSKAVLKSGDAAFTGGAFTSSVAGTFTITATYEGHTASVEVSFINSPTINFTKRVLIEDYTGTWCGWCPRVSRGIELVKEATDKAVVVAIHSGSTNPSSNGYDPYNFNVPALESLINLQGYPTAMLNRTTEWNYPEPNNVDQVVGLAAGANPNVGLALKAAVSGGNINLEVKTKFGKDFTGAKLVVYVLENGLIFNQVNYTTYFGGNGSSSVIQNFTHEHVLRGTLTNILGDAFTPTESVYDSEVTKTFNVAVPANVSNVANLEFVAFVVGSNNKALNARNATAGENQTLEVIE